MIHIRHATAADLPAVHGLVAELAAYVNASEHFTATLEQYRADFAAGFYRVLVATDEERVIGMALYHFAYSTWKGRMIYLEDFVLEPAYRRQGVGSRLWEALKDTGREAGCKLLKWQVVDTNTAAQQFYAAQQGMMEANWINGKVFL